MLLNEIRRTRKARGVVAEIALFEGERFGDSKEASLEFAKSFRGQFSHGEKLSKNRCEQQKRGGFSKAKMKA